MEHWNPRISVKNISDLADECHKMEKQNVKRS